MGLVVAVKREIHSSVASKRISSKPESCFSCGPQKLILASAHRLDYTAYTEQVDDLESNLSDHWGRVLERERELKSGSRPALVAVVNREKFDPWRGTDCVLTFLAAWDKSPGFTIVTNATVRAYDTDGNGDCPSSDVLLAYCSGTLAEDSVDAVEAHLDRCEDCNGRLEALEADGQGIVGVLRRSEQAETEECQSLSLRRRERLLRLLDHAQSTIRHVPHEPGEDDAPEYFGRYHLARLLGRGGMGTVWLAHDPLLSRNVALKIPHDSHHADDTWRDRFVRESRAAAQLSHANICPIHEVGEHNGRPYMTMAYVAGPTLKEWMERQSIEPRRAARLLAELARAVAYAHSRGVVHRDLKPSNVLVDEAAETPILTDFGLAKCLAEADATMTQTGAILGTPTYMSPEQASGATAEIGPAADIYSLGVILYELLTGETPYRGSPRVVIQRILQDDPPPPRRLNDAVPRDLETITLKCLEKQPQRRYASCEALIDDLQRYLDGRPIAARRVSRVERAVKWSRRRPALAALAVVSAVAAIGLISLGSALWYKAEQRNADLRRLITTQGELGDKKRELQRLRTESDAEQRRLDTLRRQSDDLRQHTAEQRDRSLFATQLQRVRNIWRNDPDLGLQLLSDESFCPPGLQDFTWRYWRRLCVRMEWRQESAGRFGLSPDNSRLAYVRPEAVFIVQASDGQGVAKLAPPEQAGPLLTGAARDFTSDGQGVVALTAKSIVVWRGANFGQVRALPAPTPGYAFELSRDDKRLFLGLGRFGEKDGAIQVWNLATGALERTVALDAGPVMALACSHDGATLAASTRQGETVWLKLPSCEIVNRVALTPAWQLGVAFAPDDSRFAVTSSNGEVTLFDPAAGKVGSANAHEAGLYGVSFCPDGQTFATGSDHAIVTLWDAAELRKRFSLKGHPARVDQVTFFRDGRRLAAFDAGANLIVWNALPPEAQRFETDYNVLRMAYSAERDHFYTVDFQSPLLFERRGDDLKAVRALPPGRGSLMSLAVNDGAQLVAAGSAQGRVFLWDQRTGQLARTIEAHVRPSDQEIPFGGVAGLAFLDNHRLITGAHEMRAGRNSRVGEAKVWDLDSGECLATLGGHPNGVQSVAVSPDGRFLLTGSSLGPQHEGKLRIWDAKTYELRSAIDAHATLITSIVFSPDGTSLATAGDRVVFVWDWNDGHPKRRAMLRGHLQEVMHLAFEPGGDLIATAGQEGAAKLWDPVTGEERGTLPTVSDHLTQVLFDTRRGRLLGCNATPVVFGWEGAAPPPPPESSSK